MADTKQSAENRLNLRSDFLSASAELESPERDDFTLSNSDRHLLHAAALAQNGNSAGFILPGAQQTEQANPNSKAAKRKEEERQRDHLTILEQARQLSERLSKQIVEMEAVFEAEYGDAWREHIANKVMAPDEIPHRRQGESMKDYRERLETVLIATMIDPNTSEIRPEYANSDDPDVRRYADWAQARHRENELANTPPDQMQDYLAENADWAEIQVAEQAMSERGADRTAAVQRTDDLTDAARDLATEAEAFGKPPVSSVQAAFDLKAML